LDTGLGTVLGTALTYDGTNAAYVFAVDSNDDLNSPKDQELWAINYNSGTGWDSRIVLTSDNVSDSAPRLAYDPNGSGELLLFWVHADEIRMARGAGGTIGPNDVADATTVVTAGGSWGAKDFDLVTGDQGRIALVWSDVSAPNYSNRLGPDHFDPNRTEPNCVDPDRDLHRIPTPNEPDRIRAGYDIWVAYRDPNFGIWSLPRQLTWDDAAERFATAAFQTNAEVLCVYNKRQTEYHTIDFNDPNNPNNYVVHVRDVPQAGRSDLVYLSDGLKCDLSTEIEDVSLTLPNPMPQAQAAISANLKNLGVSPASNIEVVFYDDTGEGDTWAPISTRWITGPLAGGDETEVGVLWTVPETAHSRRIRVSVDPHGSQNDADPNNNTVAFKVLTADLTVSEIAAQPAGPNTVITVRVANQGVLPAYDRNNQVEVVLKDPNGTVLGRDAIERVEPSTYRDVSFKLSPLLPGVEMVYAILDEPNSAQADPDGDGDVDLADYAVPAEHWLCRTCSSLLDDWWCGGADLDMSGEVNWSDVAILRMDWLGQLQDENGDIDEFNEDNNVRSVRIR
jgi:hypothetical protein